MVPTRDGKSVVDAVRRSYRRIVALPDLAPGPATDAAFTDLVRLATAPSSTDTQRAVLADPTVRALTPHLRRLCGDAEFELEQRWATRVVTSADPKAELRAFPYYDNYRRLTRLEYHAVTGLTGTRPRRIAFVGSGPLPLTSALLDTRYRVRVDNLDIDPAATRSAGLLARALSANRLRFHTADVLDHRDFAGYDAVWLAALVGLDGDQKRTVLAHLFDQICPGTLLLARSSHGLRELLYPPLAIEDLGAFQPLAVLHPYSEIINSMVVARKP